MTEQINVSIGELFDRFTILKIKKCKIKNKEKLVFVTKEINFLNPLIQKYNCPFYDELRCINEELWNIEDQIRQKEVKKIFDDEFIDLARRVYLTNDKRAKCKERINKYFHSDIREVKEYN